MNLNDEMSQYVITQLFKGQIPQDFSDEYDLIDQGILDSVATMSLVTYIEKTYQIEFGEDEIVPEHLKSVKALANFIDRKLSQCA